VILRSFFYCPREFFRANGSVGDSPEKPLAELLEDIASLSGGVEVALNILFTHLSRNEKQKKVPDAVIIETGRNLLVRADFSKTGGLYNFGLKKIISACFSGKEGESAANKVCDIIKSQIDYFGESVQPFRGKVYNGAAIERQREYKVIFSFLATLL